METSHVDRFLERLRERGTPEGQLSAYKRGATLLIKEAAGETVRAKHVEKALVSAEANGMEPKDLAHFKRIGDAFVDFLRESEGGRPRVATGSTASAGEARPCVPTGSRGGASSDDALAIDLTPILGTPDGEPQKPSAGVRGLVANMPPSKRKLVFGGGIAAIVAIVATVAIVASKKSGAASASPENSASTAPPSTPTKLRIQHVDLGLTLPAGWVYAASFDTIQTPPGGSIRTSVFFQGAPSESARRVLSCQVVWLDERDTEEVSQSSTDAEILKRVARAHEWNERTKRAKGEEWSCEGTEIVRVGPRRAARCRGTTTIFGRTFKQVQFHTPVGHRMTICGALDESAITPELEADATSIVASFQI